jgi:hypothetical protein
MYYSMLAFLCSEIPSIKNSAIAIAVISVRYKNSMSGNSPYTK